MAQIKTLRLADAALMHSQAMRNQGDHEHADVLVICARRVLNSEYLTATQCKEEYTYRCKAAGIDRGIRRRWWTL